MVNDPNQCPKCRSEDIDVYDTNGGPPDSTTLILKCACNDCGFVWRDTYTCEFDYRTTDDDD